MAYVKGLGYVKRTPEEWRRRREARFWSRVGKNGPNGCWLYNGPKNNQGYGCTSSQGFELAHRYSWRLRFGPIPKGTGYHGTCVLHHCDNPGCVNPDHLFLGTAADNMADSARKGRMHPKLTADAVREIRQRRAAGETFRVLGEEFGVSRQAVWQVVRRRTWRHVA